MSEAVASGPKLPEVGTTVVHNDSYAKGTGPVYKVTEANATREKPIRIAPVNGHKLNKGLDVDPLRLTQQEFDSDYKQL